MKCDFCSAENVPLQAMSCKTFTLATMGIEFAGSPDNWAACEGCAAHIAAEDPDALARRSVAALAGQHAEEDTAELLEMIKQVQAGFFACRSEEFSV